MPEQMPESCCELSSAACCNIRSRFVRYQYLLAQSLGIEGKSKMSGLLDETGVRNPTSQSFCYLPAQNVCASSHVFLCEGCFRIPLLRGKSCCSTNCRPARGKLILPFPHHSYSPSVPPFPGRGQEAQGSRPMHLSARRFTSLTESSTTFY